MLAAVLMGMNLVELLTCVVILAAVVAVVVIALHAMGWKPPGWAVQMFWVVVIAFVAIVAIRLIASM